MRDKRYRGIYFGGEIFLARGLDGPDWELARAVPNARR